MPLPSHHATAVAKFEPTPSLEEVAATKFGAANAVPPTAGVVGVVVGSDGDAPGFLGLDRAVLAAAGFDGEVGQTLLVPRSTGPILVAVGTGERAAFDATKLRDAAAAFTRACPKQQKLALLLPDPGDMTPEDAAQAAVEGVILARYRYRQLKWATQQKQEPAIEELTLVSANFPMGALVRGIERGRVTARATELVRDLANAPATLLTARRMEEVARAVAAASGLEVEVFDEKKLLELGCGGILGVNAGSDEPPRLIKLIYRPKGKVTGRVSVIGKGIMYDSGGLSLKPNDLVHAAMKSDMGGAGAILGAMSALQALGCENAVTGYLMCTDNMPSGNAMRLGDVLTVRGGTTVEVLNTDAEGRLVMADGLVLATEEVPRPDAILDIATLTGACERALGNLCAGVMGNDEGLVDQVRAAGDRADERVWPFRLDRRLRKELDSDVADLKNVGLVNAGQITAGLFLEEFVDGVPWAHIDIAGTARCDRDDSWRSTGATGYGTRLLIELLTSFTPPGGARENRPPDT